jgi:YHS domain-containing protein
MFRLITYLLLTIFLYSVVRAIVKIVLHGFGVTMQSSIPRGGPSTANTEVPLTGELKRDPVCGTFIAVASSIQQIADGKTVYFCSSACRDKYVASLAR